MQRLLIGQGHRIDSRIDGQLNVHVKQLEGQIHNEIERIERALQTENDFHHLEKEFDGYLQSALDQFQASSYQVRPSPCDSLHRRILQVMADRLEQAEHEWLKLAHLGERLGQEVPSSHYAQFKEAIQSRQASLQTWKSTCEQARDEHEQLIKTQQRFTDEAMAIEDWFKRVIDELSQPLQLDLSLTHLEDLQHSLHVSLWTRGRGRCDVTVVATGGIDGSTPRAVRTSSAQRTEVDRVQRWRHSRSARARRRSQTTSSGTNTVTKVFI